MKINLEMDEKKEINVNLVDWFYQRILIKYSHSKEIVVRMSDRSFF